MRSIAAPGLANVYALSNQDLMLENDVKQRVDATQYLKTIKTKSTSTTHDSNAY